MKLTKTPLLAAVLSASAVISPAYAENPYYANDIDAAVRDAERNGVNQNYVGNRWYNRTTSKSFDFPKLMNSEMEDEIVEGALDSTAAGPGDEPPERESPLQLTEQEIPAADTEEIESLKDLVAAPDENAVTALRIPDEEEVLPTVRFVESIEFTGNDFQGRATGISSDVSSTAYITPE